VAAPELSAISADAARVKDTQTQEPQETEMGAPSPELCNLWLARAFNAQDVEAAAAMYHPDASIVQVDQVHGGSRTARQPNKKAARRRLCVTRSGRRLLDLRFLEFDVLLGDRIVLAERQLVRLGAAVLTGHVEEAGIGGRQKLDLDVCGFGHDFRPLICWSSSRLDTGDHPDAENLPRHIKNIA
jgi:hypothetical protein